MNRDDCTKIFYNDVCNTIFDVLMAQNAMEIETIITVKNFFAKSIFEDKNIIFQKSEIFIPFQAIKSMMFNQKVFDADYLFYILPLLNINLNCFDNADIEYNVSFFKTVKVRRICFDNNSDPMECFVLTLNKEVTELIEKQVAFMSLKKLTESE